MATYTKETALYDTGAISEDIADAGTKATNYIAADDTGIMVYDGESGTQTPSNVADGTRNVFIDEVSVNVRDGKNMRASFGETTVIGEPSSSRIVIDNNSISGYGESGKDFFSFTDSTIPETISLTNTLVSRRGMDTLPYKDTSTGITATITDDLPANTQLTIRVKLFRRSTTGGTYTIATRDFQIFSVGGAPSEKTMTFTDSENSNVYRIHISYDGANTFSAIKLLSGQGPSSRMMEITVRYELTSLAACYKIGQDLDVTGAYSYAEGRGHTVSGDYTHAEGRGHTVSGSYAHAEGRGHTVSGNFAHAEGYTTSATGAYSHAEGYRCVASYHDAHAEGSETQAKAEASHAEGMETIANAICSHAGGSYTIANKHSQMAIGRFNISDESTTTTHPSGDAMYGQYPFIIGNGTAENARSNAFTVGWDGNVNIPSGANYKINGTSIFERIHDMFVVESVSKDNISIAKSSYKTDISVNASKTGYTPLGVVGWTISDTTSGDGTNYSWVNVYRVRLDGTNIVWSIRNTHTTGTVKFRAIAYVLYVANN